MADFDEELDVTGERCPVPVFKTQKALNPMKSGEILHVISDDPVSIKNMDSFIDINPQYELLESKHEGNAYFFLIKKT
jgi:tRNA 2-thiouridine synthesizing protein A